MRKRSALNVPSTRARARIGLSAFIVFLALCSAFVGPRLYALIAANTTSVPLPVASGGHWVNVYPKFAGNRPLPANPRIHPQSQQMMDLIFAQNQNIAGPGLDDEQATFFTAKASDPLHAIHCTNPWGPPPEHQCAMEAKQIHIPAGAFAATNTDHHTSILDADGCTVYDLWETGDMSGALVTAAFGAETNECTGNGFNQHGGAGATAGNGSQRLGRSPLAELETGAIHHAVEAIPACNNGGPPPMVGQATNGSAQRCNDLGPGIPMGAYLWSDVAPGNLPPDLDNATRMICVALNTYGAVVNDTNGGWYGLAIGALWNAASDPQYAAWAKANMRDGRTDPAACFPNRDWSHHIHVLAWQ